MADVEIHTYVKGEHRASVVRTALAGLSCEPLRSLTLGRHEYSDLDLAEALRLLGQHPDEHVAAEIQVRSLGQKVPASLVAYGNEYPVKYRNQIYLILSQESIWTSRVEVPLPRTEDDGGAVALSRWYMTVHDLLSSMSGIGGDVAGQLTSLGGEGTIGDPFNSFAIIHGYGESVPLDFARGWLASTGETAFNELVVATREELCQRVASASERVADRVLPDGYDASLSRADIIRILEMPSRTVFEAVEAVALPNDETRRAIEKGRALLDMLASGAPKTVVEVSRKLRRMPFQSNMAHLGNGCTMLHAGPLQRLWPIYRDAAALLLSR